MLRLWLACLLGLAGPTALLAQNPGDLSPRDKAEVFIQHLVKVVKLDPVKYKALVLEYEVGNALTDFAEAEKEHADGDGDDHHDSAESCCATTAISSGDFIERAISEIFPDFAQAAKLRSDGKAEAAREILKSLSLKADPYLSSYAALELAELEHAQAAPDKVIALCERLSRESRMYLIKDHRACELVALAFEKLKKPLHEAVQYLILLTDYNDLPAEVGERAKARLAQLEKETNQPLSIVGGWMSKIGKLLEEENTSKDPTQSQGTEVVSALDKLIELQEARERKT